MVLILSFHLICDKVVKLVYNYIILSIFTEFVPQIIYFQEE